MKINVRAVILLMQRMRVSANYLHTNGQLSLWRGREEIHLPTRVMLGAKLSYFIVDGFVANMEPLELLDALRHFGASEHELMFVTAG